MTDNDKPIANPLVMLREEFDDWAVLFNPDTGHGFGLNPTGVYLWKIFDGKHTIEEMITALRRDALGIPGNARHDVRAFVDALITEGLAGFQATESGPLTDAQKRAPYLQKCSFPSGGQSEAKPFTYELPTVVDFREGRAVGAACCNMGSYATQNACGSGDSGMNAGCVPGGCAARFCDTNGTAAGGVCNCFGTSAFLYIICCAGAAD